jgi:hypothetical protein
MSGTIVEAQGTQRKSNGINMMFSVNSVYCEREFLISIPLRSQRSPREELKKPGLPRLFIICLRDAQGIRGLGMLFGVALRSARVMFSMVRTCILRTGLGGLCSSGISVP